LTDRLPQPLSEGEGSAPLVERASATSARAVVWAPRRVETASRRDLRSETLQQIEERLVEAITGSEGDADAAALLLTPGPELSARERLEVYRFGYRARLVECLDDDYPILARTLGQKDFERLAIRYIERFPSRSPNLNAFGRRMAELCRSEALDGVALPAEFMAGLAELEWALVEVIHAREPAPFDLASLQGIPIEAWATARLVPSDTVRLLRFAYPMNAFYQACRGTDVVPQVPAAAPTATAVYRSAWRLWRMDLTPAMTRVLAALLEGVPVEESLGRLGLDQSDPAAVAEAERSVMVWFKEWVQSGFFAGLTLT
jgi:hypothetical protein